MERMGLVAQVEAELEKMLSLELLPADGILPSESKLSRCFGVSRGTVREALLRLVAKGLVVTHPGRQARAVPLGQAVSLENMGVLLEGDGRLRPDRRRLLEGYLALKRDITVELLAACCERANAEDLAELGQACFALGDSAHWDMGDRKWVQQEFDLLRLAALAADRPGHVLLIHSLERAFKGMARWLQPRLHSEAVRPWTWLAMKALDEKDAQALRLELPALLLAGDEKLLLGLAPLSPGVPAPSPPPVPEATQAGGPGEVAADLSDSQTVEKGGGRTWEVGSKPIDSVGKAWLVGRCESQQTEEAAGQRSAGHGAAGVGVGGEPERACGGARRGAAGSGAV